MEVIIAGFVEGILDGLVVMVLGAVVRAIVAYQQSRFGRAANWLHDFAWPIALACAPPSSRITFLVLPTSCTTWTIPICSCSSFPLFPIRL